MGTAGRWESAIRSRPETWIHAGGEGPGGVLHGSGAMAPGFGIPGQPRECHSLGAGHIRAPSGEWDCRHPAEGGHRVLARIREKFKLLSI